MHRARRTQEVTRGWGKRIKESYVNGYRASVWADRDSSNGGVATVQHCERNLILSHLTHDGVSLNWTGWGTTFT